MPSSVETFLNEQRADIAALNAVLQVLLVRLITSDPATATAKLLDLKSSSLAAIARIPVAPTDQDGERMKQMTAARAEAFFAPLEEAFAGAEATLSGRVRN